MLKPVPALDGHKLKQLLPYLPIVASLVFAWNWVLPADDALIYHRYVENYLENGEIYFNSGDRVLGVNPAWVFLLSGLSRLFPIDITYKLLAAVGYLGLGTMFMMQFSSQGIARRLLVGALFASNLHLAYWFFSGLDSFFIPLFAMFCLFAVQRRSIPLLLTCFSLAIVFRPEAWIAIFPIVTAGIYLARNSDPSNLWSLNRKYIATAAGSIMIVFATLSWIIIRHYDNFIPMSILAKSARSSRFGQTAIEEWAAASIAPVNVPIPYGYVIGVLIIGVAAYLALRRLPQTSTPFTERSLLAGAVIFGSYLLLTGAWVWGWYYAFISYVVIFLVASSSIGIYERLRSWAVAPLAILIALLLWSGADFGNNANERIRSFYIDQMQVAAEFIDNQYADGTIVITGSSGYFGMHAPNKIVQDGYGLWSPEIVAARQLDREVLATDVIPWDVVVCRSDEAATDPISHCLGENKKGRLIATIGGEWVIENAE